MANENNKHSIKYYVKKHLINNSSFYNNKTVVDFPAGNGITSRILMQIGAKPVPFDLFPEYFEIEGLNCKRANINKGLPITNKFADALICQEGIEHFTDQYNAFKEFNRVLKNNATLLITTPNYSNIRSRLSYFLNESERYNLVMPPNELDSVWMTDKNVTDEIYFGHIFLIGMQKLRVLAKLSGFKVKKCHTTQINVNSLVLFPIFYPFIFISNCILYLKNMRKITDYDTKTKKLVYGEIFRLAINPKLLVVGSLMVEFEKEQDYNTVAIGLKSRHKSFGIT